MTQERVTNASLFKRAKAVLPGGVSSPVRAFKAVAGDPIFYQSAKGSKFIDCEGREFLDFVMSWGPLIHGHANTQIVQAVTAAAERGTSFGAPCEIELQLAEKVKEWHFAVEKIRFVSSGTEAVMSAIRLARAASGRNRIVKFSGCYHGHSDSLLVAAGSGLVTFGRASSAGVPDDFVKWTTVLPLDDEAALEQTFREVGNEIAAVIIEPVPANNGLLLQRKAYLEKIRQLTVDNGALLVFDEVITGFRIGPGGASQYYDIKPDLVTFGKVIGGGMPVGAFAGKSSIMDQLAPEGPVYQAGTLSGNPVAMAAGLAALQTLETEDGFAKLEALGAHLESRVNEGMQKRSLPYELRRIASLFWLAPKGPQAIRSAEAIPASLAEKYKTLHSKLLERGIYIAPSAYEVGFLSTAHTVEELDFFAENLIEALAP